MSMVFLYFAHIVPTELKEWITPYSIDISSLRDYYPVNLLILKILVQTISAMYEQWRGTKSRNQRYEYRLVFTGYECHLGIHRGPRPTMGGVWVMAFPGIGRFAG